MCITNWKAHMAYRKRVAENEGWIPPQFRKELLRRLQVLIYETDMEHRDPSLFMSLQHLDMAIRDGLLDDPESYRPKSQT